jgi:hypothetical protein
MLTTEEFGLLRKLIEWRRANGWTFKREYQPESRDYLGAPNEDDAWHLRWESPERDGQFSEVETWIECHDKRLSHVLYRPDDSDDTDLFWGGGALRVHGARIVADGLVSVGVLPQKFSSAFQAGRESAYDRDKIEWGMCRAYDGRVLKAWDEEDARTSVAHNRDLSLRTRRVGPWVRVPEAGGRDADA